MVYGNVISTSDVWFPYDGWNLIAGLTMIPSSTTRELTRSYAWGPDLSGGEQGAGDLGGLLLIKTETSRVASSCDRKGNAKSYLNALTGALLEVCDYDAFGRVMPKDDSRLPGGEGSVPFQVSTKSTDRETGLTC